MEAAATTIDLSSLVSTVKDQGNLGSCVAHGTTSGFEAVQIKAGQAPVLGDRLLCYRDARIIGGEYPGDNGCNIRDGIKATVQNGVAPETDWPYVISQFDSTPPAKAVSDALKDETIKYVSLDSTSGAAQTLVNIKNFMATTGLPVVYGMTVYEQYENVGSDGIIASLGDGGAELGGHCNMFFGYQPGYIWTLNSWGVGWGKAFKGYGGKQFGGGMGLLPENHVTGGNVSDCWGIVTESMIPTPTPTPTPPTPTGVKVASAPSVCSAGGGVLDLVVKGSDTAVWWRHFDGATWSAWASLGGKTNYAPAIATPAAGFLDVFAHGTNGALYHRHYDGKAWAAWETLGGTLQTGTSPSGGGSLVFVQGTDAAVWYRSLTNAKWTSIGSIIKQ
jgi:hypothetical protein